MKNFIL